MAGLFGQSRKHDNVAQSSVDGDKKKKTAKDTWAIWRKRLGLGSHYGIERFGVMVGACVVSGGLILGSTVAYASQSGKQNISSQAQYTDTFVTTKTQNQGVVSGVYRNGDHTRALVLMKLKTPSEMPRDIRDYHVQVSGIEGKNIGGAQTKVHQATVGSLYMFGDTGYIGVLLEAPEGFDNQLMNLTIRTNTQIAKDDPIPVESLGELGYDESFLNVDQWRVIINPAADSAISLAALDEEGEPDLRQMLADTVFIDQEALIRKTANDQLANLRAAVVRMSNMEEAMTSTKVSLGSDIGVRLVPPVLPKYIEGDVLEGRASDEVSTFLDGSKSATGESMFPPEVDEENPRSRYLDFIFPREAQERAMLENEEELVQTESASIEYYVPNTLSLHARNTFPGGINMDWRSRTIVDGYISGVVPQGEDPHEYIHELVETEVAQSTPKDIQWALTNGKMLDDYDSTNQKIQPLLSLAANAETAYEDYYKTKLAYQRVTMSQFLGLELDLQTLVESTTTATGSHGGDGTKQYGIDVLL